MSAESQWLAGELAAMEQSLSALVEINSFTDNPGRRAEGRRAAAPGLRDRRPHRRDRGQRALRGSPRLSKHRRCGSPPLGDPRAPRHRVSSGKFEGYRVDGELRRGPGVLDMKGGLVVVAWALKAVARTVGLGKIAPLRVVVVADEEVGSPEGPAADREEHRRLQALLRLRVRPRQRRDRHPAKGTGAITVHLPREGGARRQQPCGWRQRAVGAGPLRSTKRRRSPTTRGASP